MGVWLNECQDFDSINHKFGLFTITCIEHGYGIHNWRLPELSLAKGIIYFFELCILMGACHLLKIHVTISFFLFCFSYFLFYINIPYKNTNTNTIRHNTILQVYTKNTRQMCNFYTHNANHCSNNKQYQLW